MNYTNPKYVERSKEHLLAKEFLTKIGWDEEEKYLIFKRVK